MGNLTGNADEKSTKTGKNDKTKKNVRTSRDKRKRQHKKKNKNKIIQLEEIDKKLLAKDGRLKRYQQSVK